MNQPKASLRERAIALLARREHSLQELKTKLALRGFLAEEINLELEWLVANGLQSDERFAESYVRYRVEAGFGPLKILAELRQRGISSEQAARAFTAADLLDWHVYLVRAYQKKFATMSGISYARQMRFLLGRGFNSADIRVLLNKAAYENE